MEVKIDSVVLKNSDEFLHVYNSLIDLFNKSEVELFALNSKINFDAYFFVKSHRSSVTEGNTTSVGEFTQLVIENLNDNNEYIVPKKIHDETYEIVNLKKVYEYLKRTGRFTRRELQRAHSIIGEKIIKNNLMVNRGKLKTQNNFVPFILEGIRYNKVFSKVENVKSELNNLFTYWSELPDDNPTQIFAKYIILQLELISIHPFIDGNGRVARAFSESYFESKGFIPYTPYSSGHKMVYQDNMGYFSVLSQDSIYDAYLLFASFILDSYTSNVEELMTSISDLKRTITENNEQIFWILLN